MPELIERTSEGGRGRIVFHFHRGQLEAWDAEERIVAIIAGTQGGKTSFGPVWMQREIQRRGVGAYLIAAPSDPLLHLKLVPDFKRLFVDDLRLGVFTESPRPKFTVTEEGDRKLWGTLQEERTVVNFGYASKPDSLESMTAKAAWLDEAGQESFRVGSWEAILRRLSLAQGRILITTTPYNVQSWLKRRVFDKRNDPRESIRVVQFRSADNPSFPPAEIERARRDLPPWRFRMMYEGEFERPAGLIYDNVDEYDILPRYPLPERLPRFVGLDFGGQNTCAVFYAEESPGGRLILYRTYHAGGKTAAQHTAEMMDGEPRTPVAYGGAASEQQWRDEFTAAGFPVKAPTVTDVEVGINRVYAAHARRQIIVFDDLDEYLAEKGDYVRSVDENGQVLETISQKNRFHHMDAERYIIGSVRYEARPESQYVQTLPGGYYGDEDMAYDRFGWA